MQVFSLDTTYKTKTIKTNAFEFRFRHNAENDYFYYNLFDIDGNVIRYHNKVATGYQYDGFSFSSDNDSSYAKLNNIDTFKLVVDE